MLLENHESLILYASPSATRSKLSNHHKLSPFTMLSRSDLSKY